MQQCLLEGGYLRTDSDLCKNAISMTTEQIELILVDLFKSHFSVDFVNTSWNFFDIGINSIELIEICEHLSKRLNKEINIITFYEFPTISTVAQALSIELGY